MKTFRVLRACDPQDRRDWLKCWEEWPNREVFAHPSYLQLFSDDPQYCLCAVMQGEDGGILYPFVQRPLALETYVTPATTNACDITSPYGYGGAYVWGADNIRDRTAEFWLAFDGWATRNSVVSEFIRFGLLPETILDYPGQRIERQSNVLRALDLGMEALWMDYEHKVRKNVNRATRAGVSVELDEKGARLEEFLAIYSGTMNRRAAASSYYFNKRFFESLITGLPGQFAFFHANLNGKMVSTELVLISQENIYSFLGGTEEAAFQDRPNDLLKHEVIRWGKFTRKTRYVLGGGYEEGDGVFRYKRSFSPRGIVPFFVGHRVLDSFSYRKLVDNRKACAMREGTSWVPKTGFFPEYRA